MDKKLIKDMIIERNDGMPLNELSKKYEIPAAEIKKILKDEMDDAFYSFDINYKTDNPEKIQKILSARITELVVDFYPDNYDIPSKSHKFIKITDAKSDLCIGLDVKATYYESVVQSAWKYKKYHQKVGQLFIILISRRIRKDRLKELLNNKPDNVTIIPYTDIDAVENIRKKLMKIK